jgi:hypothetical protein
LLPGHGIPTVASDVLLWLGIDNTLDPDIPGNNTTRTWKMAHATYDKLVAFGEAKYPGFKPKMTWEGVEMILNDKPWWPLNRNGKLEGRIELWEDLMNHHMGNWRQALNRWVGDWDPYEPVTSGAWYDMFLTAAGKVRRPYYD